MDTHYAHHESYQPPLPMEGWPTTPPQSTLDSRRPSLAVSTLSHGTNSDVSTPFYSQPVTPVHSVQNPADVFAQPWYDDNGMSMETGNGVGEVQREPSRLMYGLDPQQAMCMNRESPGSIGGDYPYHVASSSHHDAWQQRSFDADLGRGLTDTLYQSTQGLGGQDHAPPSMAGAESYLVFGQSQMAIPGTVDYQTPQVVVPSHLNPPDYSGWQPGEPPSPGPAYPHPEEPDVKYAPVKEETSPPSTTPPTTSSSSSSSSPRNTGRGPKRRPSRKAKKSPSQSQPWYTRDLGSLRILYAGKPFEVPAFDSNHRPLHARAVGGSPTKLHPCPEPLCTSSFERREHLRRHTLKHTGERPYPCPLADCAQRSSRSDNATDHFKTHLGAYKTGKRNRPCAFAVMEAAIVERYAEREAAKLLAKLRAWRAGVRGKGEGMEGDEEDGEEEEEARERGARERCFAALGDVVR